MNLLALLFGNQTEMPAARFGQSSPSVPFADMLRAIEKTLPTAPIIETTAVVPEVPVSTKSETDVEIVTLLPSDEPEAALAGELVRAEVTFSAGDFLLATELAGPSSDHVTSSEAGTEIAQITDDASNGDVDWRNSEPTAAVSAGTSILEVALNVALPVTGEALPARNETEIARDGVTPFAANAANAEPTMMRNTSVQPEVAAVDRSASMNETLPAPETPDRSAPVPFIPQENVEVATSVRTDVRSTRDADASRDTAAQGETRVRAVSTVWPDTTPVIEANASQQVIETIPASPGREEYGAGRNMEASSMQAETSTLSQVFAHDETNAEHVKTEAQSMSALREAVVDARDSVRVPARTEAAVKIAASVTTEAATTMEAITGARTNATTKASANITPLFGESIPLAAAHTAAGPAPALLRAETEALATGAATAEVREEIVASAPIEEAGSTHSAPGGVTVLREERVRSDAFLLAGRSLNGEAPPEERAARVLERIPSGFARDRSFTESEASAETMRGRTALRIVREPLHYYRAAANLDAPLLSVRETATGSNTVPPPETASATAVPAAGAGSNESESAGRFPKGDSERDGAFAMLTRIESKVAATGDQAELAMKNETDAESLMQALPAVSAPGGRQPVSDAGQLRTQTARSPLSEAIDLVARMAVSDQKNVTIQLQPGHLGHIQGKIAVHNGRVTVKLDVDSESVQGVLQSSSDLLKESLQREGMDLQALAVTVSGQEGNGKAWQGPARESRALPVREKSRKNSENAEDSGKNSERSLNLLI